MYCPKCGQERLSEATSFCSRCGYLLTGTAELLRTGGVLPASVQGQNPSQAGSPRSRGLKQGLFIFLLSFPIVPILGILSVFLFRMNNPWPVGIALFALFFGGLLRMAYALMFESKDPVGELPPASLFVGQPTIEGSAAHSALPPQQTQPAAQYAAPATGRWLDTNELEPTSVTESTTRLLEREDSQ